MKLKKLKAIDNLTQVDKVELGLQEFFKTENFKPGDAIPKEVELAEAMGVSRTAIREALSRFRLLGIVESRKNRGMIITRPDILNNMERVLDTRLLDGQTLKEIFELRLILEIGIADVLFIRKNQSNLRQLELIVEQEEKTTNKEDLLKLDVEFHSTLYKISGNDIVLRFQKMLMPIFDYVYRDIHVRSQIKTESFVSHKVLLNVLKSSTPEEFRNKMKEHLKQYFEVVTP